MLLKLRACIAARVALAYPRPTARSMLEIISSSISDDSVRIECLKIFSCFPPGALLTSVTVIVCFLCSLPTPIQKRKAKARWQRVYTGDESVIEINVSSLRLEPGHILRVEFRTILSKPESLKGTPVVKYKSRLETIDFKLNDKRYRLCETTLLDPNGKTLQSYTTTSAEDWRTLKEGGVMERLFNAARALPPFGSWKAVAYRLADGSPNGATPPEIAEPE